MNENYVQSYSRYDECFSVLEEMLLTEVQFVYRKKFNLCDVRFRV